MKVGTFFGAMVLGCILLTGGSSAAEENKGAESITLNGGDRGSVTFPHGRHQGIFVDCKPCHDLFPKEAGIVDKMKAEGKLQKREVMNMCKDCHKSSTEKGQKAGPVFCKECHKK